MEVMNVNLLKTPLAVKLGLTNKFAYTRDNKPVYRNFLYTNLPSNDFSWYSKLFVDLKKNAIQLCFLGRGKVANLADLRQDDYAISFYYIDSDGDLSVFDTSVEFCRILLFAINQKATMIKFKAEVKTKPDRIMGGTAIDSSTQICSSLRKFATNESKTPPNTMSPLSQPEVNSKPKLLNKKQNEFQNQSVLNDTKEKKKSIEAGTIMRCMDTVTLYATNCHITIVDTTTKKVKRKIDENILHALNASASDVTEQITNNVKNSVVHDKHILEKEIKITKTGTETDISVLEMSDIPPKGMDEPDMFSDDLDVSWMKLNHLEIS